MNFQGWLLDLRHAARTLTRAPGFTLSAALTLALGIGATTAIFSVVHGVLLRTLPYSEPERLVSFVTNQSYLNLRDVMEWTHSFESGGGWVTQPLDLVGGSEPIQVPCAMVTGDLFRTLRVRAARGRAIDAGDDRPGGARVAVVQYDFWRRQLDGDPQVVGKTLRLSDKTYTIVGVMPEGFQLPNADAQIFAPLRVAFPFVDVVRGVHFLRTVLRLAPGATLDRARPDVVAAGARLAQEQPEEGTRRDWRIEPVLDRIVGGVRTALWILFGAVLLVLLVSCSNFANLLLARAASRRYELGVRLSLGAGRGRLVQQLVTESVLLALVGGALGVLLAIWGVDLLIALKPAHLPRLDDVGVDVPVLAFAALLSIATGVVFGLIPALQSSNPKVAEVVKQGAATTMLGRHTHRLLGSMVISQIGLALMLLIGAGLLLNAFVRLHSIEPGFDPEHLLTLRTEMPEARYEHVEAQNRHRRSVLEALARIPGAAPAIVSDLPLTGEAMAHDFVIEGRDPVAPGDEPQLYDRGVMGDYFGVMRIPIVAGRAIASTDGPGTEPVGVINQAMAAQYFRGENPLGRRFRWARDEKMRWFTIVGVAGDVKHFAFDMDEEPAVYTASAQFDADWKRWTAIVVRSGEQPEALARQVKQAVWSVDPAIPITDLRPMRAVAGASLARQRFVVLLIGLFAAVALLLAAIGIYGVTSYAVGRRTREIGLRVAIGATRGDVFGMVLGRGLRLVAAGIVIGVTGAIALSGVLRSQLYKVSATDPITYVMVAGGLALVAIVACTVPALRAARLDPLEALRSE